MILYIYGSLIITLSYQHYFAKDLRKGVTLLLADMMFVVKKNMAMEALPTLSEGL